MNNYIIKYWKAGKTGYYYTVAESLQRARDDFNVTHTDAQLLDIQEN